MARRTTSHLTAIWIGLLVTTLVVAGVATFLIMRPRPASSDVDGSGVWNSVLPAQVNDSMEANAVLWGTKWYSTVATTRARAVAARYLDSLPGGAKHGKQQALLSKAGARSGAQLVKWAAGLPHDHVATAVVDVKQDGSFSDAVNVSGSFTTSVHQARKGKQSFTSPVDLVLTVAPGAKRTDLSGQAKKLVPLTVKNGELSQKPPTAWRIDKVTSNKRGLRLLPHPVIVPGSVVDVVADDSHLAEAKAYQVEAVTSLQLERRRWSKASPPGSIPAITTVYLLDSSDLANKLLHHGKTPEGTNASGWTFENGDVVLLTTQLARRLPIEQLGVVRHELTHVANLPLLTTIPTLFLEGVATVEETARSTAGTNRYLDLRPLLRAFNAQTIGYDKLLRSRETAFGETTPQRVALGYLAGYATIAYIDEQFGHDKLQEFLLKLDSGATVDTALTEVLHLTARQLADNTRGWTNVAVHHPTTQPATTSPMTNTSTGDGTGNLTPGT